MNESQKHNADQKPVKKKKDTQYNSIYVKF